MSRQRYSLQRSRSWDDKRVKQIGLDIEVYDNYTGYARPANTLSGGETFLASLSLALGLADVVQAYSGVTTWIRCSSTKASAPSTGKPWIMP